MRTQQAHNASTHTHPSLPPDLLLRACARACASPTASRVWVFLPLDLPLRASLRGPHCFVESGAFAPELRHGHTFELVHLRGTRLILVVLLLESDAVLLPFPVQFEGPGGVAPGGPDPSCAHRATGSHTCVGQRARVGRPLRQTVEPAGANRRECTQPEPRVPTSTRWDRITFG